MKPTIFLMGLMAMAVSLSATTINFAGGGALGTSNTYGPVVATGYFTNLTLSNLFGKGTAGNTGSEDGLGLQRDPTGDDEIFPGNDFIQLDISSLSGIIQIAMASTGGDTWAIYGSNTLGVLGMTSLASGGSDDGVFVTVMNATSYHYLDVKAVTNNVLLQQLSYTARVPEPGTLGIVGLGGVLIGLLRRKLRQN
jgi:hypothetical protein